MLSIQKPRTSSLETVINGDLVENINVELNLVYLFRPGFLKWWHKCHMWHGTSETLKNKENKKEF